MKKELEEKIISRFPCDLHISRVKKFEGFIKAHYTTLRECYNNYSIYKEEAYNYCKELFNKVYDLVGFENLINWGIVSYNIMQFTYVINFTYQDKKYSYYITKDYNTLYAEE